MNLKIPDNAQRPPKQAVWSWTIDLLFLSAILLAICSGISFAIWAWNPIISIVVVIVATVLVVGLVYVVPRFRYRFYYYVVSPDEVLIQKGAFTIRRTVVPFARVQNIETYHGPVDRKLGLINVRLHTAASPIEINCIPIETGEKIREEMMARVKSVRDELAN